MHCQQAQDAQDSLASLDCVCVPPRDTAPEEKCLLDQATGKASVQTVARACDLVRDLRHVARAASADALQHRRRPGDESDLAGAHHQRHPQHANRVQRLDSKEVRQPPTQLKPSGPKVTYTLKLNGGSP